MHSQQAAQECAPVLAMAGVTNQRHTQLETARGLMLCLTCIAGSPQSASGQARTTSPRSSNCLALEKQQCSREWWRRPQTSAAL